MSLQRPVTNAADAVLFRPVRAGYAFEEAVERVLTAIKLGLVTPGERLPAERNLAERLGVSRVTLREALRELQRAGYVECSRGRYGGTFVKLAQPRTSAAAARRLALEASGDLDDVLILREVLEVGAAARAAASGVSIAARRDLEVRLAACRHAADSPDYRRLDSRLHLAIAEVTGSASLTSAVAAMRMRLNLMLDAIPVLERNIRNSDRHHDQIVAAIVAGDVEAARDAMAAHIAATAALLRGFIA